MECGVSRDGSKASNILRAARAYGMTARGFNKEPDELAAPPRPVIAHWNMNHCVVVEGFAKDRVYINDPASGPRVISRQQLEQSFTGVMLTSERTPEYVARGKRPP